MSSRDDRLDERAPAAISTVRTDALLLPGPSWQGKIRVMLVPKALLVDLNSLTGPLRLEADSHSDRVTTLKAMQEDFHKGAAAQYCMNVRLNVAV